MRKISNITDFFVISSGNSTRQKAITDHLVETLKSSGHKKRHVEGYRYALWVLLDYGDVWVHVFCADTRKFYDLERLWADAPALTIYENNDKKY